MIGVVKATKMEMGMEGLGAKPLRRITRGPISSICRPAPIKPRKYALCVPATPTIASAIQRVVTSSQKPLTFCVETLDFLAIHSAGRVKAARRHSFDRNNQSIMKQKNQNVLQLNEANL